MQLYHENLDFGLKLVTNLRNDHVYLTPYSIMNVRIAAQVLSETVANVLFTTGPADTNATAKLCLMMDQFFNCLNVRNTEEHTVKLQIFLKPYKDVNDARFAWLDKFLEYLALWKQSTLQTQGNFHQCDHEAMFLPWQSYEGLRMTVLSLKVVVQYLLNNGMKYVMSEKFCQDDIENCFGKQRAIRRRKDNLNIRDAGYNDNMIKLQFSVKTVGSNVHPGESKWNVIDNATLPKKKRK